MLSGGPLMLAVLVVLGLVIAVYVISRNVKMNKLAISELKSSKSETIPVNAVKENIVSEPNSEEEVAAFLNWVQIRCSGTSSLFVPKQTQFGK